MVNQEVPAPLSLTAPDGDPPDVAIIAVTYNSSAVIRAFLHALPEALGDIDSAAVIIVDNSSSDGTPQIVHESAPWAVVIPTGENLGYAAAINIGLRRCRARRGTYILNPDAVPAPGSVALLLEAADSDRQIGMAVPRMLDSTGQLKYSLRREPTLLRALGEALLGGRRSARYPPLGDLIRDPDFYVDGATADWATGAALFVPTHASDIVGSWDERFFLYSEETDYALRLRDHGLRVQLVEAASVTHPGGDMSRSPWLWSLVAVNRTRLYAKRHGRVVSALYWLVVLANECARSLLGRPTHWAAVKALLRGHPALSEYRVALNRSHRKQDDEIARDADSR